MKQSNQAGVSFGPYSPVYIVGDLVFVSGQVGVDAASKKAGPTAAAQTQVALENMQQLLKSVELTMDAIVKTTIYATSVDDYEEINAVYQQYFSPPRPARSFIGVKELPRVGGSQTILVEIEAIADKSKGENV